MKKIVLVALMALCSVSFSFGLSENCRVCLNGTNNNMEVCVAACPELNDSTKQPKYPSITPPSAHPQKQNVFSCGLHVYDSDGKLHDCCEEDCTPFLKK